MTIFIIGVIAVVFIVMIQVIFGLKNNKKDQNEPIKRNNG